MSKWAHTLDLSDIWVHDPVDDEDPRLPDSMAQIAMRAAALVRVKFPDDLSAQEMVEELEDAADEGTLHWFNVVWDAFYDFADDERIWVKTR